MFGLSRNREPNETSREEDCAAPEKNLLVAVFQRAMWDLNDSNRDVREEVIKWVDSNSSKEFSFIWVMSSLNWGHLVPDVRKRVAFMRRKVHKNNVYPIGRRGRSVFEEMGYEP